IFVEGGSLLTQAVVGGSVDIAQNGYTPAAGAAVQGADIVFIGGISNKLPFQLVVNASITNAAQLKGQSIAISRFGSSTDTAGDYPNTSYVTSRTFLKKNPELVKRFFMAMATAIHEYKRNPDLAITLTRKFLNVKDEANAKAAYESYIKVYPDDLQPSIKGIS